MTTLKQSKVVKKILENIGNPKTPSKGEILKEAGYSDAIVKNPKLVMDSKNIREKLKELIPEKLLSKAERNLDKILDLETREAIITLIGPLIDKETGKIMTKENPRLLGIQADISKFIAERIGKTKYGQDVPAGNRTLIINITPEVAEKYAINASPS